MTIVFSGGSGAYLVMANDSAVVNNFSDGHVEYTTGRKFFALDGVGVVTMWGARQSNRLAEHLDSLSLSPRTHNVEDLAYAVQRYLTETYSPHADSIGDTGYHVGGFTGNGEVRLYHIHWNVAGSGNARTNWGAYTLELHHPPSGTTGFMYNGRHDVVSKLMQSFIDELSQKNETNFPFTAPGACRLAHFILRVSSEITKEVAPPFVIHLLSPSRRCVLVTLDPVTPSTEATFAHALQQTGLA